MDDTAVTLFSLLGKVDNLHDPVPSINKRGVMLGILWTLMSMSWVCGVLRLYVRGRVLHTLGWDDLFLTAYLLTTTMGTVTISLMVDYGLGQHFLELPIETMQGFLLRFWLANSSYCLSTTFIKMSLLCQYLRAYENKAARRLCKIMLVITTLWGFSYSFIAWFPCLPMSAIWSLQDALTANCWAFRSLNPTIFTATFCSHSAINMAFDVIIFSIPVPLYFRRNTDLRTRLGVLALFLLGMLVVFVSVWRLVSVVQHRATTVPTFDPTWYGPAIVILAAVEVDLASMCASAPVFWPVLRQQIMKVFVTQQIEIIREEREEGFAMHRTRTAESEEQLVDEDGIKKANGDLSFTADGWTKVPSKSKQAHYQDEYVRKHVDPLTEDGGVKTNVAIGERPW